MTTRTATRCTVCSYDLAGLDVHSVCPECGSSIAEQSREIPIAEVPGMLALLARRMPRVSRAVVVAPVSIGFAIVIEAWWIARELNTIDAVPDLSPIAAIPLMLGGFYTAWAWIGVTPRTLGGGPINRRSLRPLVVLVPVAAATVVIVSAVLKAVGSPAVFRFLPAAILGVAILGVAAAHTLGLLHLRWISARTRAGGLARRLRRAALGPSLTLIGWVAAIIVSPLTILIDPITGLVPMLWIASSTLLVPILMVVWLFEARAGAADLTRRLADLARRTPASSTRAGAGGISAADYSRSS